MTDAQATSDQNKTTARSSTENKGDSKAKAGKPMEGVESGTFEGRYSDEDVKAVFVEKINRGETTFTEDQMRGLAHALGVEDDINPHFFGEDEESPTAGATPATGSGGVPYEEDAATDETREFADELAGRAEDEQGGDRPPLTGQEKSHNKRLQEAGMSPAE